MDKMAQIHRVLLSSSLAQFTTRMFQYMNKTPYIMGEHHKIICDALDHVAQGDPDYRRLIINIAPRYGKCVAPDTRIMTKRGLIDACEVKAGDEVYSFEDGKAVLAKCAATGVAHKDAVKITMRSGRCFVCSADHPMLTTFGYKSAGGLQTGDRIQAIRASIDNDYEINDDVRSLNKKAVCITDTFPYEIISKERLTYKVLFSPYRCSSSKDITREKFVRLSEKFECLKKYICEDFYLDKVVSVESVGEMDLIDIEVDGTHNFIGNGLVSHNTLLVSQMFIAYGLALNPMAKTIHLSYSGNLVMDNSMAVKDIINCEYFQQVFSAKVKRGSDTKTRWSTEQGGGVYATSTLGQITGFGAGLVDQEETDEDIEKNIDEYAALFNPGHFNGAIVIDDPIRPDDALSDVVREKVNLRFETTIRNRVNSRKTPIIIIMQRLHEHDLCGYLMETEPDKWKVISLPVLYNNDKGEETALWPFKHTVDELHQLHDVNPFVFETQYMQNPKPLEGLMYSHGFRTYNVIPHSRHSIVKACCDSADTGADFLCDIIYVETETANYVLDVLYTKKPMEYTEPKTAERYTKYKVQRALVESNNGGRTFARNVESQCRIMGNNTTRFTSFTQTGNKQVRIFTRSAEVQNLTYFPDGWQHMWPEFARSILNFLKEGRNEHDDGPDCLTMTVEHREISSKENEAALRNLIRR